MVGADSISAPEAGEKISWGMATFTLHGNLVHYTKPLPLELIGKMVRFRVAEQIALEKAKNAPKPLNEQTYRFRAEIKKVRTFRRRAKPLANVDISTFTRGFTLCNCQRRMLIFKVK